MIKKRILATLLTMGLLMVSVPVQVHAGDAGCEHLRTTTVYTEPRITGGYYHSYSTSQGTKECRVDFWEQTGTFICHDCGATGTTARHYDTHSQPDHK